MYINHRLKGSLSTSGLNKLHILEPPHKKLVLPSHFLSSVFLRFLMFWVGGLRDSPQPFSVPFAPRSTVLLQEVAFLPLSVPPEGPPLTYAFWRETIKGRHLFRRTKARQQVAPGRSAKQESLHVKQKYDCYSNACSMGFRKGITLRHSVFRLFKSI